MTVAELRKYLDGYPDATHEVTVDMGNLGNGEVLYQFHPVITVRMSYRNPCMVIEV